MKPLACGLLLAFVITACSAGARKPQQTAAHETGGGVVPEGRPQEEIRRLDEEITAEMASLGLQPPTDTEITEMVVAHSVPAPPDGGTASASCEVAQTNPECDDVCTLADSICENADRICVLADQLAPDEWAVQRCASGRASCERATQRCCDC
jgi:hypothetical protein